MDARGKFGEHERGVRDARGVAESNSSFLSAILNYLSNTDGAEQKGITAKGRVECSSFPPNFRLNSMTSNKHRQDAKYIPRWRRQCTIFGLYFEERFHKDRKLLGS